MISLEQWQEKVVKAKKKFLFRVMYEDLEAVEASDVELCFDNLGNMDIRYQGQWEDKDYCDFFLTEEEAKEFQKKQMEKIE